MFPAASSSNQKLGPQNDLKTDIKREPFEMQLARAQPVPTPLLAATRSGSLL